MDHQIDIFGTALIDRIQTSDNHFVESIGGIVYPMVHVLKLAEKELNIELHLTVKLKCGADDWGDKMIK